MLERSRKHSKTTILPFIVLFSPFVIFMVESIFPYPFFIEELGKFLIVYLIIEKEKQTNMHLLSFTMVFVLSFILFETFLYISDFSSSRDLFKRIILTGSLHTLTVMIMYGLMQTKIFFRFFAPSAAMLLHFFFNFFVKYL